MEYLAECAGYRSVQNILGKCAGYTQNVLVTEQVEYLCKMWWSQDSVKQLQMCWFNFCLLVMHLVIPCTNVCKIPDFNEVCSHESLGISPEDSFVSLWIVVSKSTDLNEALSCNWSDCCSRQLSKDQVCILANQLITCKYVCQLI